MEIIFAGTYLVLNSILDIRKKEVSIKLSGIYAVIGILVIGMNRERVFGVVLGLIIVFIAKLYKEIGIGDGIVIIVLGLLLGLMNTLNILLIASILASILGGFLLITKRIST